MASLIFKKKLLLVALQLILISNLIFSSSRTGFLYQLSNSPLSTTDFLTIDRTLAVTTDTNTPINSNGDAISEVLDGVFMKQYWENYSDSYDEHYNSSDYYYEDDFYYIVYDNDGNLYYIIEEFNESWSGYFDDNSYYLQFLVDSDESVIKEEGIDLYDLRNPIYYQQGLTGDELVYTIVIYYFDLYYCYDFYSNYQWYNELWEPVDPNEVIPNLQPEDYYWASFLNESYRYYDEGYNSWAGYSVDQLIVIPNTNVANVTAEINTIDNLDSYNYFEIENFFEGFSIYNDSNGNGITDMEFNPESLSSMEDYGHYGFPEGGEIDSELTYSLWLDNVTLEKITDPVINSTGIYWSVTMSNLNGELESEAAYLDYPASYYDDYKTINVTIPVVEFDFFFSINNSHAELKLNQYIGPFTYQENRSIVKQLEGLSLSINYWVTTIKSEIQSFIDLTEGESNYFEFNDSQEIYSSEETDSELLIGVPFVSEDSTEELVDIFNVFFGGSYIVDNNSAIDYEVATVVIPQYAYKDDFFHQPGVDSTSYLQETVEILYYSSCYPIWDGKSIYHDPIFRSILPETIKIIQKVFPWLLFGTMIAVLVISIANLGLIIFRLKKRLLTTTINK